MLAENIKISGHGIKNTNLIDRWQSREWEELACLFIEDNSQSENIRYLLEQHISKVIDGIKICQRN
jgi:NADH-quinone oxidoreductase subunit F